MKKRLLSLLMVVAMILPLLLQASPAALSAQSTVSKDEASRAIAVVFDNSGSMWAKDKNSNGVIDDGEMLDSWCRATYALEVFASMMNKGDRLLIYPMNKGITDGPNGREYSYPIEINDPADAGKIRDFYSTNVNSTLFQAVEDAYNDLRKADEDEKHLIILTDGVFQYISSSEVQSKLDKYSEKVQVYFLAIGEGASFVPKENNPDSQFVRRANMPNDPASRDIVDVLAEFCNLIFGRNLLPSANRSGNSINFDVSMEKMILFIQGEGIDNVSLSGGTKVSQQAVRYSEIGSYYCIGAPYDEKLQGMIVVYEDIDAGAYDLSFSGQDSSVSIYYEPDVDLQVLFRNADGEFDPSKDPPYAGEYTMSCRLVDRDGNPVESSLLGNPEYEITCVFDGKEQTPVKASSTTVELKENETFSAIFKVRYLDGYIITLTGEDLNWSASGSFEVEPRPISIGVELDIDQDYYVISQIEKGKPIIVRLTRNGFPMEAEDFEATKVDIQIDGIDYKLEKDVANSRYVVRLKGGDIKSGMHKVTCKVSGTDGTGKPVSLEKTGQIECQPYPEWVRWVFWIGLILLIIIIVYAYLNTKVLPKLIRPGNGSFNVDGDDVPGQFISAYTGKGSSTGTLSVRSPRCLTNPRAQCGFNLELQAVSPRSMRSSSRRVRVTRVTATNPAATNSIRIGAVQFVKDPDTNKFSRVGARPDAPVEFNIGNNCSTMVSAEIMDMTDGSSISCSMSVQLRFY